jgi:NAD+ synthase (glutamine-hydrolysing)
LKREIVKSRIHHDMKIVLAQCNFTVGDFAGNCEKMAAIYQSHAEYADAVVFSELAISGYYPSDLLTQSAFLQAQDQALAALTLKTLGKRAALITGFIDRNLGAGKPLHNALGVLHNGALVYRYHKRLLPTYNIFDEARHFEPGTLPGVFSIGGNRIGLAICEDLWNDEADMDYDDVPIKALSDLGVAMVLAINASPSNLGKYQERLTRFQNSAARHQIGILSLNQVGGNDEIVFDGNSFYIDREGKVQRELAAFTEDVGSFEFDRDSNLTQSSAQSDRAHALVQMPTVMRCSAEFFNAQITLGLRDYTRKCGFKQVIVGSSGGIDSALTIALAAAALGPENVLAVTMPSRYSSDGSVNDSVSLCGALGVTLRTAPIEAQFALAVADFERAHGAVPSSLTQQNIQARLRGRMLMEVTNHSGHLLLSTGNKSEMSVGYATLYGDMNGGLNLIGDLYKMDVYALSRWLNERAGRELIPQVIIDKEPSAELAPGQKDSDALPIYPILDAILRLAIEGQSLSTDEITALRAGLAHTPLSDVDRVLKLIARAEFKRRQAPPIIRCQRRAFGIGWRMPIAQAFVASASALLGRND